MLSAFLKSFKVESVLPNNLITDKIMNILKKNLKIISISFVAGLLVNQFNWNNTFIGEDNVSLADIAMKRVTRDLEFVTGIKENVSISDINVKTRPFNYQFSEEIPYNVRYLNHCGFAGEDALYLILEGKHGDVSVFLTNTISKKTTTKKANKNTLTMPIGNSSIILIGNLDENLEIIANQLTDIVKPM